MFFIYKLNLLYSATLPANVTEVTIAQICFTNDVCFLNHLKASSFLFVFFRVGQSSVALFYCRGTKEPSVSESLDNDMSTSHGEFCTCCEEIFFLCDLPPVFLTRASFPRTAQHRFSYFSSFLYPNSCFGLPLMIPLSLRLMRYILPHKNSLIIRAGSLRVLSL